jgi:hypothetical protein
LETAGAAWRGRAGPFCLAGLQGHTKGRIFAEELLGLRDQLDVLFVTGLGVVGEGEEAVLEQDDALDAFLAQIGLLEDFEDLCLARTKPGIT